jgi:hypothetical protein
MNLPTNTSYMTDSSFFITPISAAIEAAEVGFA